MGGEGASTAHALFPPGRAMLLDDLAVLRLYLEDSYAEDEHYEALARVVGALQLTPEEEGWLERQ